MWPLLLCAILAATLVAWELAQISVSTSRSARALDRVDALLARGMVAEALAAARESDSAAGRTLAAGLERRADGPDRIARAMGHAAAIETSSLDGGLVRLATLAVVSPLLGFLIATLAMLRAIDGTAAAVDVPTMAAPGVVPAASGLALGIAIAICYRYCARLIEQLTRRLGESGRAAVDAIDAIRAGPASP